MTFGKELARLREEHPLFANHYLAYQELKDAVAQGDVSTLMARLRQELDKINDIVNVEMVALRGGLQARCRKLADGGADVADEESLSNLAEAIIRLHAFVETNYLGFQKIMKNCAERQETACCSWFLSRVEEAAFRHETFDDLLVPLGQLYAAHRQQQPAPDDAFVRGLGPQAQSPTGEGNSQDYFVQAKDITRLKVYLLKHLLPAGTMTKAKTTSSTRDTSRMESKLSRPLVHVYLEGSAGNQYAERYKRRVGGFAGAAGPKSVLLRCRMAQGDDPGGPDQEVEVDVEDEYCKTTTFKMPQKSMGSLLAGKVDAKFRTPAAEAAAEAIRQGGLRPAISAAFRRSSFTMEGADGTPGPELVSVDERMLLRDEAAVGDAKAWCFAASMSGAMSITPVPFTGAILRLWVPACFCERLLDAAGVAGIALKSQPGFSEALHATALLHRELATPLPPWIQSEPALSALTKQKSTLLAPPTASPPAEERPPRAAGASKAKERDPKVADEKQQSLVSMLLGAFGGSQPGSQKLTVDCKVPMAIERTLLRWMRSMVMLASLSAFLISSADPSMQLNGVLLGFVGLIFVVLPSQKYWKLSKELQAPDDGAPKQPKVDRFMPTTITSAFCIILFSTVVVSVCGDTSP